MKQNLIKRKIANQRVVIGPNVQIDHPWIIEIIGNAGFDWVMIDGEHGAAFSSALPSLIIAAENAGMTPIVRVPSHERGYIIHALEAGAGGVQVPFVDTPEEAVALVRQTKYPPIGQRGFSNVTRAGDYGAVAPDAHMENANREQLLIVQIETEAGLQNADRIADVPGVDGVFVGPCDLAQSLGLPVRSDGLEVRQAVKGIFDRIRGKGVFSGTSAVTEEEVRYWSAEGVQLFVTGSMNVIRRGFETLNSELRSGLS